MIGDEGEADEEGGGGSETDSMLRIGQWKEPCPVSRMTLHTPKSLSVSEELVL